MIPKHISIAVDASRCRSGGAVAHLKGIFTYLNPEKHGISEVHLWTYKKIQIQIPNYKWLIKHDSIELEKSLFHQVYWQAFQLPREIKKNHCQILFTVDASTVCTYKPQVVLSQDMLSYEPGIMSLFGWGFARIRLIIILWLQNSAFRRAAGVIFLTHYAGNVIQKSCGQLSDITVVPHGIGENFKLIHNRIQWPKNMERPIQVLYVSNAAMYKYQWNVVKAIEILREKKYNIKLILTGGGSGKAQVKLNNQISASDPKKEFVSQMSFIPHSDLPALISNSDIYVFASGCENMPNTLVEGMAVGLPIACSNRGPMPEILDIGGIYFDPASPNFIANSIEHIICDDQFRNRISLKGRDLSEQYSWQRCSDETWGYIANTFRKHSGYN